VGVIGDAGEQPAQFDGGRQLAALIEGGADHPGRSFLGPQWPDNLGSVSWRWLCRLKWASSEKAGIFAFAFQSVAVPQTCRLWIWLFCLPGFLRRGRTRVMRLSVLKAMLGA
jgi:hypothetical protein